MTNIARVMAMTVGMVGIIAFLGCGEIISGQYGDGVDEVGEADGETDAKAVEGSLSSSGAVTDGGPDGTFDAKVDQKICPSHKNGVGQSYVSCHSLNSWNPTTAIDACWAYVRSEDGGGGCVINPPGGCRTNGTIAGTDGLPVSRMNGYWDFGGPAQGHVQLAPQGSSGCPSLSHAVWE